MVLFILPYKVVMTFKFVNKIILKCDMGLTKCQTPV